MISLGSHLESRSTLIPAGLVANCRWDSKGATVRTDDVARAEPREVADDLAAAWPTVAEQLRRDLRSFRIAPQDLDELLQEVALRAMARGQRFPSDDDFRAWARTVGRNLAIDWYRRRRTRQPDLPLAIEQASAVDVIRVVEQRAAIRAVTEYCKSLSEKDRAAIAPAFGGPSPTCTSRREEVAWQVRRHRVRNRLRTLLDGVPVLGGAWRALQDRVTRLCAFVDPRVIDHGVVAVLSGAAFTCSLTALIASVPAPIDASNLERAGIVAASAGALSPSSEPQLSAPLAGRAPTNAPRSQTDTTNAEGHGEPIPIIRRNPQQGPASGPGDRWHVEAPPADVDNPAPGGNDRVGVPATVECPDSEPRFIVVEATCSVLEATESAG